MHLFFGTNMKTHHNWPERVEELQSYIWPIAKTSKTNKEAQGTGTPLSLLLGPTFLQSVHSKLRLAVRGWIQEIFP
jgi:hypothetical protein